jgi:hypothetical protein
MNASSPMLCLVDEGNNEVTALRLLQRRLHLVALYWHPTISLSISFQLKRPIRPIEECSSLPTACICELSFPHSFRFRNISHWKQSLFAWCLSIIRRPISCGWISAPTLGTATSAHEGGLLVPLASHPCFWTCLRLKSRLRIPPSPPVLLIQ